MFAVHLPTSQIYQWKWLPSDKKQQEPSPFHLLYDRKRTQHKLSKSKRIPKYKNFLPNYPFGRDKNYKSFKFREKTCLSKFQKGHRCYGTSQYGTQFQNPCYSACITPQLQASPAHMHLVAKTVIKLNTLLPIPMWKSRTNINWTTAKSSTNLSWPCIRLLQAHIGFQLFKLWVDTSTRGIKKPGKYFLNRVKHIVI